MSYFEKINNGELSLTEIVDGKKCGYDWEVIVDRDNALVYKDYEGKGTNKEHTKAIKFKQKFKVSKVRNTRLCVHDIVTKKKLGWIESYHLLLSPFSLLTEEIIPIPRKAIVVSSMEGLDPGDTSAIYEQRKYYNGPSPQTYISESDAKRFQICFVFKVQDGSFLLGTVDKITGNYETSKGKILGWLPNANKTEWNNRVCLEPLFNIDNPHKNNPKQKKPKYPGFKQISLLKKKIEQEVNSYKDTSVFIEIYPNKIHKSRMRYPVIESKHNNSNYKHVVSIVKGQIDDISIYKNLVEIMKDKKLQTNIIFAIDGTISMERYMKSVAKTINEIIANNIELHQHSLKIGFIVYRDYLDGEGPCETCSYYYEPLTTNYEYISKEIANIKCYSKDSDLAEAQYNGLIKGIDALNLDPRNSNVVVLIGDCGNHEQSEDKNNYTYKDVAQLFYEKEVNLISFQVSQEDDYSYGTFNFAVQDIINYTSKEVLKGTNSTLQPDLKHFESTNTFKLVWGGEHSECDFQNMFGRFIYADPNVNMPPEILKSSVVNSLSDYMSTVDKNISIIEGVINGSRSCNDIDTELPSEGVIVWMMTKLGLDREETIKFLTRNEMTVKAFVAKNYLRGGEISKNSNEDLLQYVVFLTDREFVDLKSNLSKLIDDEDCSGIKGKRLCFESTMKDIVKKIIGDGFSEQEMMDHINNMTLNEVWQKVFQVEFKNETLKDIKLNQLASSKKVSNNKFKVFYEDFKTTARRFIKSSYSDKNNYKSRKFRLNRDNYYWIPLEDIPGAN
jgi:hypothetical protein